LQGLSADLLIRALDERPPFAEQDEAGVTYAEKIGPQDRTLDLSRPAVENERIVRALTPHIGARIELPGGQFLGVRAARAADDGRLELLEVQPAGGRAMAYADYVRGHGAVPGAA
jgi:methionyl-tRNA formyltransferase